MCDCLIGCCDLDLEVQAQEDLEEDIEDLRITSVLQQIFEGFHQVIILYNNYSS